MEEQKVSFEFNARYYRSGDITPQTKAVWFVLHGYGQLARYFLRKFAVLQQNDICVVAPEGLSHFYIDNFQPGSGRASDRVGATWMTKENRSADIDNYVRYLNNVYRVTVGQTSVPVTILGFSQGAATATRWALANRINFNRLILWSGIFPPDMDFDSARQVIHEKEIFWVYGSGDPFLSDERHQEMKKMATRLSAAVNEIVFEGAHEIDEGTLLRLI